MGGAGGDWDSLDAEARFADQEELAHVLRVLGHAGPTPPPHASTYLGVPEAGGEQVVSRIVGRDAERGEGRVVLTFAVYVEEVHVDRAARFEDWLDERHVRMVPRDDRGNAA
jgi:hypothetical protein